MLSFVSTKGMDAMNPWPSTNLSNCSKLQKLTFLDHSGLIFLNQMDEYWYQIHNTRKQGADAGKDFLVVRPKPSWQGARPFLGYTCNTIINEFGGKPTGWGFRSTGSGSSNNQFVLWNEAAEFCAPISQESTIACNIAEHSNSPSLNVGKSL